MAFDMSVNMEIIPDRIPNVLIEATNHHAGAPTDQAMTMNRSGKSAIFGLENDISVGGAPEHPGRVYKTGDVSSQPRGRGVGKPKFQGGK